MDYAVIRTGGKQYRVGLGDVIRVEKLEGEPGSEVRFDQVLAARQGDAVQVGAPMLTGALVTGQVVQQGRAKKVLIFKKKRRKNYRRRAGHRQSFTAVRVIGIQVGA